MNRKLAAPVVNAVVLRAAATLDGPRLETLLWKRGDARGGDGAGAACWSLPGGFVRDGESLDGAMRRHLLEKVGVSEVGHVEQLDTLSQAETHPELWLLDIAHLDEHALPRDMTWLTTVTLLSWSATLLGDADRARRLYALLLPYRDRSVQDVLAANWGSVERYLGSLALTAGDRPGAAAHFERALERNAGHPLALRLTRLESASLRALADPPPRPGSS